MHVTRLSAPPSCRNGSVLLLTLMVVSLLMVIVVAFTVFVRLELRSVIVRQQHSIAQANARLGAQMALSRLQFSLGPDQSVSASATLYTDVDTQNLGAPAVLPAPGQSRWTGVWRSATYDPRVPDSRDFAEWLISGHAPVTDLNAVGSSLTGRTIPLVSDGSVDHAHDTVSAGEILIEGGSFAWWVGDESQKARIDLVDDFALDADASNDLWRNYTVQRTALEPFGTPVNPGLQSLVKTRPQVDLLLNAPGASAYFHDLTAVGSGIPSNVQDGGLKRDLTAVLEEASTGNGQASGSAWNELRGYSQREMDRLESRGWIKASQNRPHFQHKLFPPLSPDLDPTKEPGGPSWQQLIGWSAMMSRAGNSPAGLEPAHQTESQKGVAPVIARFQMLRYTTFSSNLDPSVPTSGGTPTARIHFMPVVVLWNPYDVELKAADYFMGCYSPQLGYWGAPDVRYHDSLGIRIRNRTSGSTSEFRMPVKLRGETGGDRDYWHVVFRLEGVTIPPGQAKIYSLRTTRSMPVSMSSNGFILSEDTNPANDILLSEGYYNNGQNSFYFERDLTGSIDPATEALDRVWAGTPDSTQGGNWHNAGQPTGGHFLQLALEDRSDLFTGSADGPGRRGTTGFLFQSGRRLEDQPLVMLKNLHYSLEVWTNNNRNYRVILFENGDAFFPSHTVSKPDFSQYPFYGLNWRLRIPDNQGGFDYGFGDNQEGLSAGYAEAHRMAPLPLFALSNLRAGLQANPPHHYRAWGEGFATPPNYIGGYSFNPDAHVVENVNDRLGYVGYRETPAGGLSPSSVLATFPHGIEEVVSPADFQHVDFSSVSSFTSAGALKEEGLQYFHDEVRFRNQPGWFTGNAAANLSTGSAAGNSFAPMLVPPGRWLKDEWVVMDDIGNTSLSADTAVYDLSWWVNRVLWDDYLLRSAANSRHRDEGIHGFSTTAAGLWIEGAFNVNSTSVNAWRALLYSLYGLPVNGDGETSGAPFSRSLRPLNGAYHVMTDDFESVQATSGYRRLSASELDSIAVQIVRQVRIRGPFMSLSDFVNRTLVPATGDTSGRRLTGPLQAAIDEAGLNQSLVDSAVPDSLIEFTEYQRDRFDRDNTDSSAAETWYNFERDHLVGRDGAAMRGAPGYLTQADVLSRIGSVLQVRGDTFLIRSYGAAGDPANPNAKSWCEMVVQRTHGYVDPVDAAETLPEDLVSVPNRLFGRRFKVLSVKWLNEDEI